MPNDWLIDVLIDLKAFAAANGLAETAAQIEDASLVALAELSAMQGRRALSEDGGSSNVTHFSTRRGPG